LNANYLNDIPKLQ